jgi:hypothetical protein
MTMNYHHYFVMKKTHYLRVVLSLHLWVVELLLVGWNSRQLNLLYYLLQNLRMMMRHYWRQNLLRWQHAGRVASHGRWRYHVRIGRVARLYLHCLSWSSKISSYTSWE